MRSLVLPCLLSAALATGCFVSKKGAFDPDATSDTGVETDATDSADVEVEDPCPPGWIQCGDDCVDPDTDPLNCGWCDNECDPHLRCVDGVCICREGLTDCGGECVDTNSDPNHCGACNNACAADWVCNAGTCDLECGSGLTNCSGACVDLTADENNCGSCSNICPSAVGADPVCEEGTCGLVCHPDRWDIDGLPGCEYMCTFVSSTDDCNGADDDCDGDPDEGFDCILGRIESCTTVCGTGGSRDCEGPSCTWSACCAFAETCGNGCDDDCSGAPDDGCPEMCNGMDDDGDTLIDEGFDCVLGTFQACTTSCGTGGTQPCVAPVCTWDRCCASTETCGNGCDDDCSGAADDAPCPPNDLCTSPTDVGRGGRFTGSTTLAADNMKGDCTTSTGGRDVFFRFSISTASDVFISTFGSTFDTVLYAGTTCGGSELGCRDDSLSTTQSHIQLTSLAAGTYYVTLDGYDGAARGDYVLDIYTSVSDRAGDKCGQPIHYANPSGMNGDTCTWDADYEGSCGNPTPPAPIREGIYFVVIPNTSGTRAVTFSTCHSFTDFDTLLFMRSVCSDDTTETACVDDGPPGACSIAWKSIMSTSMPPGIHYLFIEAYGNTGAPDECGNYRISASGLP